MVDRATCVAVILEDAEGRVLLLQRENKPGLEFPDCWTLLGGLVENNDESPKAAAERELREETGLQLPLSFWKCHKRNHQSREIVVRQYVYTTKLVAHITEIALGEGKAFRFFALKETQGMPIAYGFDQLLQEFFHHALGVPGVSARKETIG